MESEPLNAPSVIGWREYVDLPDWGLYFVKAKADTGARSSAIDVSHIEELPGNRVRFEVVGARGNAKRTSVVTAEIVRRAHVRSSQGQGHDRLFVKTTICVAGKTFQTELSLVDREKMLTRMLLGRRSLEGVFVVDSGHCYLHGKRRKAVARNKKNHSS